jgi:hypothetical protein
MSYLTAFIVTAIAGAFFCYYGFESKRWALAGVLLGPLFCSLPAVGILAVAKGAEVLTDVGLSGGWAIALSIVVSLIGLELLTGGAS